MNCETMSDTEIVSKIRANVSSMDTLDEQNNAMLKVLAERHPDGGQIAGQSGEFAMTMVTRASEIDQQVADANADAIGLANLQHKRDEKASAVKWAESDLSPAMKKVAGIHKDKVLDKPKVLWKVL